MIQTQALNRRGWWDDDEVVSSLDFGLACGTDDFEGAFRLLHDNYVKGGHMTPHPTGWRVGIFNALPSTRVFVARDGGRVVGTVTLVQDSPLGLPMDQVYREELSALRARGRRLGEAAALTVDPGYRASGVAILLRLHRMLSIYAARIAHLHDLGMVVAPPHARFYEACFPIRRFGPIRPYPRINNTRVVGLLGDAVTVRALIRAAQAGGALGPRDDFFFGARQCREVLARIRRDLARSAMTAEQVAHFFAGHGADTATSLALATGLLTAGDRAANGRPPAFARRHQLSA